MAEVAFGIAGAAIAGIPGMGITALTGFQIGVTLGSLLFPPAGPKMDKGKLDEIRIQAAQQGTSIPIIYGRNRTAGIIIWATGLKETSKTTTSGGKGGGGVQTTEYLYSTSAASMVCEIPRSRPEWSGRTMFIRRIWANTEVVYDWRTGVSPTLAKYIDPAKLRIYDGSQTLPDPAIEADRGVGNVPAHKNFGLVVLEELQLLELNNAFPNLSFEVDTGVWTLEQVMNDIADQAEIPSSKRDFSALAGIIVNGLIVGARTEAARIMDLLSKAYFFDVVESSGILRATLRGGAVVMSIPASEIGASASGDPTPYVQTIRTQEVELPREYSLAYNSESQDFQQFSQVARRITRYSQNQDAVSYPLNLPDQYARFVADASLGIVWTSRATHTFTLSYKYLALDPGDLIEIPTEGGTIEVVRIEELNSAVLGQIEVKAVSDDPNLYVDPGLTSAGVPPGFTGGVQTAGSATYFLQELNAPYDSVADNPYLFAAAGASGSGWRGGNVQVDPKIKAFGGAYTDTVASFTSSGTVGFTANSGLGVLPDTSRLCVLDDVSTLRVTLVSGALVSTTYQDMVENGANLAVVGSEIVQFQTATLIGGKTYDLSNFLRGRRGTEYSLDDHVPNEAFALIDGKTKSFAYDFSQIGNVESSRIIETSVDYSSGLPVFANAFVLEARSRKPYAPVHLHGSRANPGGSGDVTIDWVRRVRLNGDLIDLEDAPLDEASETYEVEIHTDSGGSVGTLVATLPATSNSLTINVADQTTYGIDAAPFWFRVFQTTTYGGIGRGFASFYRKIDLNPLD